LDLRLPTAAYNGTAVWTGPDGATYNNDAISFVAILDNDPAIEGAWTLTPSFTNDCPAFGSQVLNFIINIDPFLSVDDIALDGFTMYPNPTTGKLTVKSKSSLLDSKIVIYDVTGRKLMRRVNVNQIDDKGIVVDMSKLSTGAYFVSIETNSFKIVKRIIKN